MNFLQENINFCIYHVPDRDGGNGRPSSPMISFGNTSNLRGTIHGNLSHAHSSNNISGLTISRA